MLERCPHVAPTCSQGAPPAARRACQTPHKSGCAAAKQGGGGGGFSNAFLLSPASLTKHRGHPACGIGTHAALQPHFAHPLAASPYADVVALLATQARRRHAGHLGLWLCTAALQRPALFTPVHGAATLSGQARKACWATAGLQRQVSASHPPVHVQPELAPGHAAEDEDLRGQHTTAQRQSQLSPTGHNQSQPWPTLQCVTAAVVVRRGGGKTGDAGCAQDSIGVVEHQPASTCQQRHVRNTWTRALAMTQCTCGSNIRRSAQERKWLCP